MEEKSTLESALNYIVKIRNSSDIICEEIEKLWSKFYVDEKQKDKCETLGRNPETLPDMFMNFIKQIDINIETIRYYIKDISNCIGDPEKHF